MRRNLLDILTRLADLEYQRAVWLNTDAKQLRDSEYDYFELTTRKLLDDFIWDARERLIGALFRDKDELEAALAVVIQVAIFLQTKPINLPDDAYINDADWLPVIATARNAVRILHQGDQ
jgi:hypothetical protein